MLVANVKSFVELRPMFYWIYIYNFFYYGSPIDKIRNCRMWQSWSFMTKLTAPVIFLYELFRNSLSEHAGKVDLIRYWTSSSKLSDSSWSIGNHSECTINLSSLYIIAYDNNKMSNVGFGISSALSDVSSLDTYHKY